VSETILSAENITVVFSGVCAVEDVSFSLHEGELLGVVGPNGSGKTSLLNSLCGVVPRSGHVVVDGIVVPAGRPHLAWQAGIARVFQTPQMFDELSCLENLLVASRDQSARGVFGAWLNRPAMWRHEHQRWEAGMAALRMVGLEDSALVPAVVLSYGQRRLLELARGLAGAPKVLMLDEPSAGLNDAETQNLAGLLSRLHASGLSIMLIDHKVDFLDALCQRIIVLELGALIAEGPPTSIWTDERVVSAYLGLNRSASG
jgi:ABC-type branched-subunit amino acid transport system ATPase component